MIFTFTFCSIVSKDSILEQLVPIWESILEEGWLNVKAAQKLKTTLFTAGSDWFVNNLIKVSNYVLHLYFIIIVVMLSAGNDEVTVP